MGADVGGRRGGGSGGSSSSSLGLDQQLQHFPQVDDLEAVSERLAVLSAVSPGSYQHAALSARLLAGTQKMVGSRDPSTQEALEACLGAHRARYGAVGAETLSRLVNAHEINGLEDALVAAAAALG